jgi:hypothetical protein
LPPLVRLRRAEASVEDDLTHVNGAL